MADHWWWRPGWRVGRRFHTWHLTFEDQPDVQRFVAAYRDALTGLEGLDLIPDRWLHLTMQGVGFTDEVSATDLEAIVDAVRARLLRIPAFDIHFTKASVTPEAVESFAEPAERVRDVRNAVRAGIADVWGHVPEAADGFKPHVSVAYSSADGPAAPVLEAVERANVPPATARVASVQLITLNRDARMYEWEPVAEIPLG
ncbi:2'-5' RNA ligase family protein [Streptomyces daliensis]|uniref:2'-5' RNA ligase family protein n=1 Tax=Streptomyces daliensis TaxID=299421 RepID=A0A8T4J1Z7_9ACTN|nr:2'-5' RNA ligase family protein [Streptomyces daliensis]